VTVSSADIVKDWMRDEILQASEHQLMEAVRQMKPEYRAGFCKALIEHMMMLPLESPYFKARRQRMCLTLAAMMMENEDE
jgi:hypothetical protein